MKVKRFIHSIALCCAALLIAFPGCAWPGGGDGIDYRGQMRSLVISLADYARLRDGGFIIIPQNGQELITADGEPDGPVVQDYAAVIDGSGREDLLFGYVADNHPTPAADRDWMIAFCDIMETIGIEVLVTDYVWNDHNLVDQSYADNAARGYISFAPPSRELDGIPGYPTSPPGAGSGDVASLDQAANFLYLLNPESYGSRGGYLASLDATEYDVLIVDALYGGSFLSAAETAELKTKPGGASRLVLAYLSIGEAEDYRYYWDPSWYISRPEWLLGENPDWEGNYLVQYWDPAWQAVLFGSPDAYLDRILASGFDGVYLDIIDAYERFE
jgi:cysteinyl-tRNA synthetase